MLGVNVEFQVKGEVDDEAAMFIVGDCQELGQWKAHQAVQLQRQSDSDTELDEMWVWTGSVQLPRDLSVSYRFFVGKVLGGGSVQDSQPVEVISWETNIEPRKTHTPDTAVCTLPLAVFGAYDGCQTISHGWLENQNCVQVRLYGNPFSWRNPNHRSQLYSIKCTALDYAACESELPRGTSASDYFEATEDESTIDQIAASGQSRIMVYNLNSEDQTPRPQPDSGCIYNPDDYLVFISRGIKKDYLGFQLKFFAMDDRVTPRFIGTAHVVPNVASFLRKEIPIIGTNFKPLGLVQVETLQIQPLGGCDWTMEVSYQNHWKWRNDGKTLNVGHRGMGSSYKSVANSKENTVTSLFAAAQNGADFVEMDVLLTKDHVPVIYHDFSICLSTAKKVGDKDMLEVGVKDLYLHKLQSLKLFHHSSASDIEPIEISDAFEEEDRQPFPTLQRCLERVDQHLGFNIEVKYPQLLKNGESEGENYFDLNIFLDRILQVVLKYSGERKIIFSTFHADTCIMLNLKQNKYPVLFLHNGPTLRYTPYKDWRCTTFQHGIAFAKAEKLLGVNFQAEGLLKDLSLVSHIQAQHLVLFVWGEDLNQESVKTSLRKMGVDAIIFDRIGHPHPDEFQLPPGDPVSSEKASKTSSVLA